MKHIISLVILLASASLISAQQVGDREHTIVAQEKLQNCAVSQLSAEEDRNESDGPAGGLGHFAMVIAVQNVSTSACALEGVPKLNLLDKVKHTLSVPVCENCADYLFPRQGVTEVRLKPKAWAYLLVAYDVNDDNGKGPCRISRAVKIYMPAQAGTLEVNTAEVRSCRQITVTPFLAKPLPDLAR